MRCQSYTDGIASCLFAVIRWNDFAHDKLTSGAEEWWMIRPDGKLSVAFRRT